MKAYLMYPDRDFDLQPGLPWNADALTRDRDLGLGLGTLFDAMAAGDGFLREVAQHAILSSLDEPAEIRYRQDVLRDCLDQPDVVRELYAIAVDAIAGERKVYLGILGRYPDSILSRAVEVLQLLHGMLRRLRQVADHHATAFRSEGFTRLFTMIATELDDEYLYTITDYLNQLRFRGGVLVSVDLGPGNKGTNYVLRTPTGRRRGLRERIGMAERTSYSFQIADRDEAGAQALSELRGRGINLAANALSQATDHILAFFAMLRAELGFYLGCLDLHERLTGKGEPTCFPEPKKHRHARHVVPRALRPVPQPAPAAPGDRQRPGRRPGQPGHGHRRQPGRQVHFPVQRRPGPTDDAGRHVRPRPRLPLQRLRRAVHPLQTRRRPDHGKRQARRGTTPDEPDRRPPHPDQHGPVQRIIRCHQRTRRLRKPPARSSAPCARTGYGSSTSPTSTTSHTACTTGRSPPLCSPAPADTAPSGSSQAHHNQPATAKTSTSESSTGRPLPQWPPARYA